MKKFAVRGGPTQKVIKFYKLIGAELVKPVGPEDQAVNVSVSLNTDPPRSWRVWFPLAQVRLYDNNEIYIAGWMITRKNVQLRNEGHREGMQFTASGSFMA